MVNLGAVKYDVHSLENLYARYQHYANPGQNVEIEVDGEIQVGNSSGW